MLTILQDFKELFTATEKSDYIQNLWIVKLNRVAGANEINNFCLKYNCNVTFLPDGEIHLHTPFKAIV